MGKQCSKCKRHSGSNRQIKLLMLGLDNAGKTTAARHYLGESIEDMVPTIGFSTMKFDHKNFDVEIYDLGGSKNIRGIWKNYYALVHGIVFVVDSTDKDRLEECKHILCTIVEHPRVSKKPILLLVNKQDKEDALNEVELCGVIEIENLVNRHECPTRVETCVASMQIKRQKDKGIEKGFHWLIGLIKQNFESINKRVEDESQAQRDAEERERSERIERVRRAREERENKDCELPNEIRDPADGKEHMNGNPFRPPSEILAEKLVKDSAERKLSVGGSRNNEEFNGTSINVLNNLSNESIDGKGYKKKRKHFKNKISPSAPDLSNGLNKSVELPPIKQQAAAEGCIHSLANDHTTDDVSKKSLNS